MWKIMLGSAQKSVQTATTTTKTETENHRLFQVWSQLLLKQLGNVASFKKSLVSSEDVYRIINNIFAEDQKKVLWHYHRCRERNCSSLGKDEKQWLSSKKNKFQPKWLFEANIFVRRQVWDGLCLLKMRVCIDWFAEKYKCRNQQNKTDSFNEKPYLRYKMTAINKHGHAVTDTRRQ